MLVVAYGVADSTLVKGSIPGNPFAPAKKLIVKNPIPNVPQNVKPLNQEPPNCAALIAAAAINQLSGDPVNGRFIENWNTCVNGNRPFGAGFPTYCESISLVLQNVPNHRRRAALLSQQATCLRGGVSPYVLQQWDIQQDGGSLVQDNCAQLNQQSMQGVLDPKKLDNLHMCWGGGLIQAQIEVKSCELAQWAITSDPARFFQLADDVDTCANGGIDN